MQKSKYCTILLDHTEPTNADSRRECDRRYVIRLVMPIAAVTRVLGVKILGVRPGVDDSLASRGWPLMDVNVFSPALIGFVLVRIRS